jgi:hypothetical protein
MTGGRDPLFDPPAPEFRAEFPTKEDLRRQIDEARLGPMAEVVRAKNEEIEQLRNAVAWAVDRLSTDGGMTVEQQNTTWVQLLKALRGQPCIATAYVPPHRAESGPVYHAYDNAPTDPHHGGKIWNP